MRIFSRLFGEVKAGEAKLAVLMGLNIFLVLMAFYIIKPLREGLMAGTEIAGLGPDELKTYLAGVMTILLIPIISLYSGIASRIDRLRLVQTTAGTAILGIFVFAVFEYLRIPIGIPYFVWVGIINMFLISQFWSFANDIYSEEAGKRLFPLIAVGASLGAVAGKPAYSLVAQLESLPALMAFGGGLLLLSQVLYYAAWKTAESNRGTADQQLNRGNGIFAVISDRYLLAIAFLILLLNLVNTLGEYILRYAAQEHATSLHPWTGALDSMPPDIQKARKLAIGDFFSDFYFIVNLLSLALQALVVGRLFKWIGVGASALLLPLIALGSNLAIAFIGGVFVIRWAKSLENSTDYSIQNTVRHALFLPTPSEIKIKAKAAIDTIFVRAGDSVAALLVYLSIHVAGVAGERVAYISAAIAAIALVLALAVRHMYRARSSTENKHRDNSPKAQEA